MSRCLTALFTALLMVAGQAARAQPVLPPPGATDPVALKLMSGFPPPPDKRVNIANILQYPNSRWAFHHMRELGPTREVSRGADAVRALRATPRDLDKISFDVTGSALSLADWQERTYTDALLVLHNGTVVYEKYHAGMKADQQHALWSMSKSLVGLLATQLIHEGVIDPAAAVSRYVPELEGSAWGNASVQDTLDMTTAVNYQENFRDPQSGIFTYLRASGLLPRPADATGPAHLYDMLPTLQAEGAHGDSFKYKSVDSEVLGWLLKRATGKTLSALLSERLWAPLRAEQSAYYWLDPVGTEVASIGLNATLRDLGRLGEMLRQGGRFDGRQVVPAAVVKELRKGADPKKFALTGAPSRAGYSYHNQWWVPHDGDGSFEAKGLNGQHIHVNPSAGLVIVKLSSHPIGETAFTHVIDRAAFAAIAKTLRD